MLHALKVLLTSYPPQIIFRKITNKILGIKIPQLKKWENVFKKKRGLEIGGPSGLFKSNGYLPLYSCVEALDGVNFSSSTVWEGELSEGSFYKYQDRTGYQYIAEGTSMPEIENDRYDFVLSCNNLEHIANPIKALLEWKRLIKTGGAILLVLPNKIANFDHNRPYTTIDHLVDDFKNNITEDDMSHVEEILKLHDLKRDPKAGTYDQFRERCQDNYNNRCIHHHVFNQALLQDVFRYCNMDVKLQYSSMSDHFIVAIKK